MAKKQRKKPAPRQLEKKSLAQLRRKLWEVMRKPMLDGWKNEDGSTNCYTCDKVIPAGGKVDRGHFLPKKLYTAHWFNTDTIRPQCFRCNGPGLGEQLEFDEGLINELGFDAVNKIYTDRNKGWSTDKQWYITQIRRWQGE